MDRSPRSKGREFERRFMHMSQSRGFRVWDMASEKATFDCLVETWRVQCKSIKAFAGAVRIGKGGTGSTNGYAVNAFDVLALEAFEKLWLIPAVSLLHPRREGEMRTKLFRSHCVDMDQGWGVFSGESIAGYPGGVQGRLF